MDNSIITPDWVAGLKPASNCGYLSPATWSALQGIDDPVMRLQWALGETPEPFPDSAELHGALLDLGRHDRGEIRKLTGLAARLDFERDPLGGEEPVFDDDLPPDIKDWVRTISAAVQWAETHVYVDPHEALEQTMISSKNEFDTRANVEDIPRALTVDFSEIVAAFRERAKAKKQAQAKRESATIEAPIFTANMAPWPAPIEAEAFIGIAGDFVRLIEAHTEADRNFLLLLFLAYAGNVTGRTAYIMVGGDAHYTNLFVCGVGPTSAGRKGSATSPVARFFTDGGRAAGLGNTLPSLASGEGLIWSIRDEVRKTIVNKKTKAPEEVVEVEGVDDKRLLVNMGEFVSALQVMRREGSTLSPVVRSAWDTGLLSSPTKNSPAKSTGAHVTIIGNISKEELLRTIEANDGDNGLLNRFLWCCSRRSKELPEGGRLWQVIESDRWTDLQVRFNEVAPGEPRRLARDGEAGDLWGRDGHPGIGVYSDLSRERYGLAGTATGRAAAQVLRLSLIYAVLDGAIDIKRHHLDAALAVWKYCEDSARYVFGDALGDPTADCIMKALRATPTGMTRTQMHALFGNHKRQDDITRACYLLHQKGLARFERTETGGRPTETWFATAK